jgi:hypothetical protein
MLQQDLIDPNFLVPLRVADGACCALCFVSNCRSVHTWPDENPHSVQETRFHHQFKINICAGITGLSSQGLNQPLSRLWRASCLHYWQRVTTAYVGCTVGNATNYAVYAWWIFCSSHPRHRAVFGLSLPTSVGEMKRTGFVASAITWPRSCPLLLVGLSQGVSLSVVEKIQHSLWVWSLVANGCSKDEELLTVFSLLLFLA